VFRRIDAIALAEIPDQDHLGRNAENWGSDPHGVFIIVADIFAC
jgi:hypothetical protein